MFKRMLLDSVPFAVQSRPLVTTTYTLVSIQDATNCPPTLISGISATVSVGNCSLCTGSLGDPVVNVSFGSGANPGQPLSTIVPGASTTLQYAELLRAILPLLPPADGQYSITNNVPTNADWFSGAADHTPNDPNGYMAFYNSSEQPGEFYSQTVDNLCGSTTYQFAAWIANALNAAAVIGVDPDITFIIEQTDGTVLAVYDTGPIGQSSSFTWLQYGFDFTTPPGTTTVLLKMINNSPGGAANLGNDLAIDDITFRPCGPVSTSSFSAASSVDSITLCAGTDTVIYGNVSSGYTNAAYLWQISSDSGATWTDISNSNALQLAVSPPVSGSTRTYRYRLLAAEATNINSSNCRVVSNLLYLTSLYFPTPDFSFAEDVCNPLQVQFSSISSPGANYDWLIDGVPYSGNQNPSHTFSLFGSYPVKLKISSPFGCIDSITKTIPVAVTPADIITTHDTTICISKGLNIHTVPALDFCWSPATYLDNAALADPVATPPAAIKYYFTAKILGANLLANGNFSGGNTGFTSDYQYSISGLPASAYFVGANPATWDPIMSPCKDHTSGNGNMLLVNGSQQPGKRVWAETVNVQPNTNYAFSTWLQSINTINPATLQFSVNGVPLGNLLQASPATCSWSSFYTTWNSGSQTTAVIAIVNQSPAFAGNGFALDDLSFAPVNLQIDSVAVSVETPAVAAFPDTAICRGMPVFLHANGAATYSWSPGAALSDSTLANPVAIASATTSYIVTGTSANGCIATNSVLVSVFPYTAVIVTPDTSICLGDPAQLQANGAVTYTWSPSQYLDNPDIANPVARPVKTTPFILTAADANHCNEIDSVILSIRPIPLFQAPPDNVIVCEGFSAMLGNKDADEYIYAWSPVNSLNDPTSPNPVASPSGTTVYNLHISDSVCDHYDSVFNVSVVVKPTPVVVAQKANDIDCSIPTSQLNAGGATSYVWSPSEGLSNSRVPDPVASIDSTTTFIVMGTDINGCSAFDTVTVNVKNAGKNLFVVPNAFSPNGDGHNDCFGIRRWGDVSIEEFSVFDRWGVRVFTTRNPGECWDGSFGGKPQEAGVYAYIIRAHSFCGEITRSGTVILVRLDSSAAISANSSGCLFRRY